MDNFTEQLIVRHNTKSDRLKLMITMIIGMIMILVLVLATLLTMGKGLFSFVGFILAVGTALIMWKQLEDSKVEYEYTFTNGELDVDKIIAKKKRREMLSVEVRSFTAFGKYTDSQEESEDMTIVLASTNIASEEFYADFTSEKYGLTRLVFCPNEKLLGYINASLPKQMRYEGSIGNAKEE